MNSAKTNKNSDESKAEMNLSRMILYNGFISFVLRLPELTYYVVNQVDLFMVIPDNDLYPFTRTHSIPNWIKGWHFMRSSLKNFLESLYTLSFILPFFFYLAFNSVFRSALKKRFYHLIK